MADLEDEAGDWWDWRTSPPDDTLSRADRAQVNALQSIAISLKRIADEIADEDLGVTVQLGTIAAHLAHLAPAEKEET